MVVASNTFNTLSKNVQKVSKALIVSYVLDWIVILVLGILAYAFSRINPVSTRHAFNLFDPSISYPYRHNTVSVPVLAIVVVVAPAMLILLIILVFVPSPAKLRSPPLGVLIRRKLWEWNAGWLGLGLALATATMTTEGLKVIAGKPRPHLLAVCDPDLSDESIRRWQVGGLGRSLESAVPILVNSGICTTTNSSHLRDAFASWPSGHSSTGWAGLLYFSLFICAKFGVKFPWLRTAPLGNRADERHTGAAPPLYLVLLAYIPVGGAFYISISRWFDYRHHGFDIISGSLLGIATAWFGFHMYQLPLSKGSGWAWAARDRRYALGLFSGKATYGYIPPDQLNEHGHEMTGARKMKTDDIEKGSNGQGDSQDRDSWKQSDESTRRQSPERSGSNEQGTSSAGSRQRDAR